MATITSADATITLTVAGLFDTPVQLQQFAAEDIFDMPTTTHSEVVMGADGVQSAGFVFTSRPQTFALQANSPSCQLLDDWINAEEQAVDIFRADGTITLRALGKVWTMTNGALTNFAQISDAKKVLQPRKFTITWERVVASPL
jgi:hypothetical protein